MTTPVPDPALTSMPEHLRANPAPVGLVDGRPIYAAEAGRAVAPDGVWIVWSSHSPTDGMCGIYPAEQEIEALRLVNSNGYGRAEFRPFGEMP